VTTIPEKKLLWLMSFLILLVGGFYLFSRNMHKQQISQLTSYYEDSLLQFSENISLLRHKDLVSLLPGALRQISDELEDKNSDTLSNEAINRIVGLSYGFIPQGWKQKRHLAIHEFSPESGQLLLSICNMDIDSISFFKLMRRADFSFAELSGAPMQAYKISEVQLIHANLSDADLQNSDLSAAKLEKAILERANLNQSNLNNANLKRADLSWAQMDFSTLINAELSGAKLNSASVRNSNLSRAKMDFSFLQACFLNDADLSDADLTGADLSGANFSGANLSRTNLKLANMQGANLVKAKLDGAKVDGIDWISQLSKWNVKDAEEIGRIYQVRPDTASTSTFIIERI
jgi:uncharacterized protein YjbI with pentapeptide repeats